MKKKVFQFVLFCTLLISMVSVLGGCAKEKKETSGEISKEPTVTQQPSEEEDSQSDKKVEG
ncbi:MAG TPA: hypothetical protein DEG06_05945, partial [Lachnospiraceae bacterium]|nr:hypothetical protein [Lachnospiraceae bacterium]